MGQTGVASSMLLCGARLSPAFPPPTRLQGAPAQASPAAGCLPPNELLPANQDASPQPHPHPPPHPAHPAHTCRDPEEAVPAGQAAGVAELHLRPGARAAPAPPAPAPAPAASLPHWQRPWWPPATAARSPTAMRPPGTEPRSQWCARRARTCCGLAAWRSRRSQRQSSRRASGLIAPLKLVCETGGVLFRSVNNADRRLSTSRLLRPLPPCLQGELNTGDGTLGGSSAADAADVAGMQPVWAPQGAVAQRDADLLHLWHKYSEAPAGLHKAAALRQLNSEVGGEGRARKGEGGDRQRARALPEPSSKCFLLHLPLPLAHPPMACPLPASPAGVAPCGGGRGRGRRGGAPAVHQRRAEHAAVALWRRPRRGPAAAGRGRGPGCCQCSGGAASERGAATAGGRSAGGRLGVPAGERDVMRGVGGGTWAV